jgi:hypothetical protein
LTATLADRRHLLLVSGIRDHFVRVRCAESPPIGGKPLAENTFCCEGTAPGGICLKTCAQSCAAGTAHLVLL